MKLLLRICPALALAPFALAAAPLNFVVVFTDEMPPEYLGAYGGRQYPTPAIDALADEGLRFDNGFSVSPMCTPARFTMQTGRFPGRCRGEAFLNSVRTAEDPYFVAWNTKIEDGAPTLAGALSDAGYLAGIAGKWHLNPSHYREGSRASKLPAIPEGADPADPAISKLMAERQEQVQAIVRETAGYTHARNIVLDNWEPEPLLGDRHNIPWITKGAVSLLREFAAQDRPFLLVTTPTGIHGPWHAASLEADLRNTPGGRQEDIYDYAPDYDALREIVADFSSGEKHKRVGMAELDHHVARIREELDRLGLSENTAVIFTADHGIEPGKASVYDRGLRVPFIVDWPGGPEGGVTEALAQHVDLSTTLALAAGADDAAAAMDGYDLRPVLADPAVSVRDYAYFECGYSRGITDGRFKYIAIRLPEWMIAEAEAGSYEWMTVGMGRGHGQHAAFAQLAYPDYYAPDQFYDLETDPYELESVWNDPAHAADQERLEQALFRQTATFEQPFPERAQPFFESETYRKLAERTRAENNPHERLDWVRRDHDAIVWPPVESSE